MNQPKMTVKVGGRLQEVSPETAPLLQARFQRILSQYPGGLAPYLSVIRGDGLPVSLEERAEFIGAVGEEIGQVDIVVWTAELWQEAMRGSEVFEGCLLPDGWLKRLEPALWLWEEPMLLADTAFVGEEEFRLPEGFQFCVSGLYVSESCQMEELGGAWNVNSMEFLTPCFRLPEEAEGDEWKQQADALMGQLSDIRGKPSPPFWMTAASLFREGLPMDMTAATVYAACEFMKQSFVEVRERRSISRQVQRQLERKGQSVPNPKVRTVVFRKGYAPAPVQGEGLSKDHPYCWPVRGHWRRQDAERFKAHEPVYVKPHVRGPQDKPLKPADKVVSYVKR